MINEYDAKRFCNEDLSLVENYDKAVNDKEKTWECHHRRETTTSKKELLEIGEYYNRPASELIFLTKAEHRSLHHKGKKVSLETRKKMSIANKGKFLSLETKRKLSESLKGKNTWSNGKKRKPFTEETRRKMSEAKKGKKIWLGKHHTDETKQKLSIASKGRSWFNNGIKNVFVKECPSGFVKGRLNKTKVA